MNAPASFFTAVLLSLFAQTSLANSCGTHSDCTSCASDDACMWVLLYNCTEKCIETGYSDPDGILARDVIWRSEVHDERLCPYKEECEIMKGGVPNPSFEDCNMEDGYQRKCPYWTFDMYFPVSNCTITPGSENACKTNYLTGLDGDFFIYMGKTTTSQKVQTYEAKLKKNLKISKKATHLSFFYALPYYYSGLFSESVYIPFMNRTAFDVYIDNKHVFRLSNQNIKVSSYYTSAAYYHPLNIDISSFADGKKHSLLFYFTKEKYSDEMYENSVQVIFIDYIQVIKIKGSTFDDWKGAPFSNAASCERYCLDSYIGDGVCDMVCKTNECKNDGGDCVDDDDDDDTNWKTILGVACGVIGGAIIILYVVLFMVVIRKKISKRSSKKDDIEMKTKKKGWSVSTKNIMFGGKEADIGIALNDTLTVTNHGKSCMFSVALLDESRCNSDMKFKVEIKPKEFYLEKNEEQIVNVIIKIFCTTTITERIEIKTDDSTEEIINLVASGKKSTRINPYDLTMGDVVGEGSFGVVHRGVYKNTYNVAIKKLKVIDEGTIEDFNKEADILEKIDSEYTVKFYGALVTEDYYCFVTEFVSYGSLSTLVPKIIQADSNGGKRILCALNIAKALKYLHENNILHRDLKPENVLVSSNTIGSGPNTAVVCKLTDFGTSKILQSKEEGNMTKVIGTPMYMAPEVINTNTYGRESDIYSFGASFFELWLGEQPFSGVDLKFYTFVSKIASGELSLTFTPDPSCPQEVVDLINKCLSKEQEHRPTIDTIISVLEESWSNLYPQISDLSLFH